MDTVAPPDRSDLLLGFLEQTDAPCPGCGYNLRALTSATCPECGSALELRVGLVEPRLGAFICGALAIGAGLGFNGLLAGYFLFVVWRRPGPGLREGSVLFYSLVVFTLLGVGWLRSRRWQRDLPVAGHWAMATVLWLMAVASAVWFFGTVR